MSRMGTLSLDDFKAVKIPVPWGHISGRWYGNRTERPILAIHGWQDNLGTFDRLLPLLPDYLGILCIDLPGHGRSCHLQPGMHYSVDDYVDIIPRVMKEYGWQKVSLLGHSMGAILMFVFAALAPHAVDMVISLDILISECRQPEGNNLRLAAHNMEKHLGEDERLVGGCSREPPAYTLQKMCSALAKGSFNSVRQEVAHHMLHRQVTRSRLYPGKYYFSRDGRIKFINHAYLDNGLFAEMARRIETNPYLVIKASDSPFVGPSEALSILTANNPNFEFHEVQGTHHVHLNEPEKCAQYIVPFLIRHRPPPTLNSWSKEQSLLAKKIFHASSKL
ncbi:serine hydrolase-like protein [Drosophila subobscura]|uniref:serine hydrolase-like protein n=1 Tax=Drosophila subobscura TaxID=7241 RepID=UPI00155A8836|nr:serine hydrolase-like protein [Drosophila subobscura]